MEQMYLESTGNRTFLPQIKKKRSRNISFKQLVLVIHKNDF